MSELPPNDPRHGLNGYSNLGCRCDTCKAAGTKLHRESYTKIGIGGGELDAPKDFAARFKTYARSKGTSMRQIGLRAVDEYMERNP